MYEKEEKCFKKILIITVVNPQVMKQWCNETIAERYGVHLTRTQLDGLWSILVSVFLLGGITGGIAGGKLADILGRYVDDDDYYPYQYS